LPEEKPKLAILYDGQLRELKGVIDGLIQYLNRDAKVNFVPSKADWAAVSADIVVEKSNLGIVGIIGEKPMAKFDFPDCEICAAELDLEKVLGLCSRGAEYEELPKFPAIERDLSIIIDENILWAQIEKAVRANSPPQLEAVRFAEVYHGKNIPQGKKSIMFSIIFRDDDGTLTHDAVDKFQADIVTQLEKQTGAKLRSI